MVKNCLGLIAWPTSTNRNAVRSAAESSLMWVGSSWRIESDVEKVTTDTSCLPEAIMRTARIAKQCTQNDRCNDTGWSQPTYLQDPGERRTVTACSLRFDDRVDVQTMSPTETRCAHVMSCVYLRPTVVVFPAQLDNQSWFNVIPSERQTPYSELILKEEMFVLCRSSRIHIYTASSLRVNIAMGSQASFDRLRWTSTWKHGIELMWMPLASNIPWI
jgi:hypothetical protein